MDALYAAPPPWDIGRPQPALLALAETGTLRGRVLDAGCGTGEHTLMAAQLGLAATGVDSVEAVTVESALPGLADGIRGWRTTATRI